MGYVMGTKHTPKKKKYIVYSAEDYRPILKDWKGSMYYRNDDDQLIPHFINSKAEMKKRGFKKAGVIYV